MLVLLASMNGCAPAAPPLSAKSTPVVKPAAPPAEESAPAVEPVEVALVARIRHPGELVSRGFGWLGLAIDPAHLIPAFGKKPMPFDIDGTVDIVVVTDPKSPESLHTAVSAPIRSVDEMRDALNKGVTWKPMAHGAYALESPAGSGLPGSGGAGPECAIAPSIGTAKARIVCADGKALELLLPYLTRTLPNVPFEHDVAIDARRSFITASTNGRAAAIGQSIASSLPGAQTLVKALDTLSAEARRFSSEVDGLSVWMDVDTRGVRVEAHLAAHPGSKADASTLSRIFMRPEAGPPDAFFRMPVDSDFTFFGAGSDKAALDALRSGATPLLTEPLTTRKLPSESIRALTDGVFDLATTPWVVSVSMGAPDDPKMQKARGVWSVFAVRSPYAHVAELARALLPAKGARASTDRTQVKLREAKMPAGFSKDAMELEITFPVAPPESAVRKGAPKSVNAVVHLLFTGRGPWTWVAISADEPVAANLLKEVTAEEPKHSLGERPQAAWFRGHSLVSGADLALRATLEPAALERALGATAASVKLPPPAPLLVSTEVAVGKAKGGGDDLILRLDAPASISVGFFFGIFQDAFSTSAAPP